MLYEGKNKKERVYFILFFISLVLLIYILYQKYIHGDNYLIFKDIGSDSIAQFYPGYINKSRRLAFYGWAEGWDPRVGLGISNSSYFPTLFNWFLMFGENSIPYFLTVNQCMKIILAGCFCYLYCGQFTDRIWLKWVLAIGYAFSTDLIIRGAWESYGARSVLAMLWLLLFELSYKKENICYMIVGTVIFFISITDTYYTIFYGSIFIAYSFYRILFNNKRKTRVRLLIEYTAIILLVATFENYSYFFNGLKKAVGSKRFNNLENSIPTFTSFKELFSGFLRTIGTDIIGINEDYKGSVNFLEDLSLYCGIGTSLLVPLAIYSLNGRKRIVSLIGYSIAILYLLLGKFRYAINGFGTMSWKTSSTWIIFLNIFTVVNGIESFLNQKNRKGVFVFDSTIVLSLGLLIYCFVGKYYSSLTALIGSAFIILCISIIFHLWFFRNKNKKIFQYVIVIITCFDVCFCSFGIINNRLTISKSDQEEGFLYNDKTVDILDKLKNERMIDTFRIDKQYSSISSGRIGPCDSLAQSYMDSKIYIGGTGASESINCIAMNYRLSTLSNNRMIYGAGLDYLFNAMIGTKYIFSKNIPIDFKGYEYIESNGDINVYKSHYGLPLIYCYNKTIEMKEFEKLDTWKRSQITIDAAIVNKETSIEKVDYSEIKNIDTEYEISAYTNSGWDYYIEPYNENIMVQIKYSNDVAPFIGTIGFKTGMGIDDPIYKYYTEIPQGTDEAHYIIPAKNVRAVLFLEGMHQFIKELHFYRVPDIYFDEIMEIIKIRKSNSLLISYMDDNVIQGTIELHTPQILFASIPYNSKWHIQVDGEEKDVLTVNCGFIGCEMDSGEHEVKIYYEAKSWIEDNYRKLILICGTFLLIIGNIIYRRKRILQ